MKKILFTTLFIGSFFCLSVSRAQEQRPYTVMFYNLENLFDTIHQPDVLDEEFTPRASKAWNSTKYWKKIGNIEEVIYHVAASNRSFPTIIGVSEIENRNVLEDIVAQPKLARANYQIVHYDSPDARGVDVALLYRPDQFEYEGSFPVKTVIGELPNFKTRDILMVWGKIAGERFYFFVNHWPSRLGGQAASESKRVGAAGLVRHVVDSLQREQPGVKIAIMGDFNDDPNNKSFTEGLQAKGKPSEVKPGDLFNPFFAMFRAGLGTLAYNDAWNLFDNIVVNANLLDAPAGTLRILKDAGGKYYGHIFDRPFLRQQTGRYKGYPYRTFVGDTFQGGYSDHFPVYILIAK